MKYKMSFGHISENGLELFKKKNGSIRYQYTNLNACISRNVRHEMANNYRVDILKIDTKIIMQTYKSFW